MQRKLTKKNKYRRLKTAGAALLLSFTLLFSGCYEILSLFEDTSEPGSPYFQVNPPGSESGTETPGSDISSEFASENTSEFNPEIIVNDYGWDPPFENFDLYSDATPTVSNDREFNAFMDYMLSKRKTVFSVYTTDGFLINNDLLLYRFSLPWVSTNCTKTDSNGDYWEIMVEYYPGTKIADAYENNDLTGLTADEKKVYEMAKQFIEESVAPESSILVKERMIHDYICFSTTYSNPGSTAAVPRYCTAVGLLLDGEANCQGYADCFNMLGRMAGLTVQSQSGSAEGSLHVWNIIRIDGTWYAVDVTYDDTTFNTAGYYYPAYIYFNSGKDVLLETHFIPKSDERVHIAEYSDDMYFYYSDVFADAGYCLTESYEDVPLAEKEIADLLTLAVQNGNETVSFYIRGQYLESKYIVNEIQGYISGAPNPITISTYHVGNNTYICGEPR